jgi:hypothetical protein
MAVYANPKSRVFSLNYRTARRWRTIKNVVRNLAVKFDFVKSLLYDYSSLLKLILVLLFQGIPVLLINTELERIDP